MDLASLVDSLLKFYFIYSYIIIVHIFGINVIF